MKANKFFEHELSFLFSRTLNIFAIDFFDLIKNELRNFFSADTTSSLISAEIEASVNRVKLKLDKKTDFRYFFPPSHFAERKFDKGFFV